MASSPTGGVRPMALAGRMARERERLIGMTDEERAWRARYLKFQELAPEEPVTPEGYNEALYNPIRRFYRAPMNKFESLIAPVVGDVPAAVIRGVTGKLTMCIVAVYAGWYYLKYNTATWMKQAGWRQLPTRQSVYPGDKNFGPVVRPTNFAMQGFENSPI